MRLIDADALKEDYLWCKSESTPWDYTWDAAMKRVDMQPTIQPESAKWISVKDRLPEHSGEYLVVRSSFGIYRAVDVCGYEKKSGKFGKIDMEYVYDGNGWYEVNNVTHWMPLPSTEGLNDA